MHLLQSLNLFIISSADPNDESPANVDAAVEWRNEYPSFRKRVLRCVRKSQQEMEDSWSSLILRAHKQTHTQTNSVLFRASLF